MRPSHGSSGSSGAGAGEGAGAEPGAGDAAGLAAAATGRAGGGGAVVESTRPSLTSKPYLVTIVIASTGQTIAHFSHPTQLSSMMTALRDVYVYSGSANLRSTMPIASSTIAKVPRPRMYSCVRTLNPCLYRSFASCRFIWRTRP